jgi:hypothetical protein
METFIGETKLVLLQGDITYLYYIFLFPNFFMVQPSILLTTKFYGMTCPSLKEVR